MDGLGAEWALLLSLGAGLSTVLGALIVFLVKGKSEKVLVASLGFAAGVMISVCILELLWDASKSLYEWAGPWWCVVFMLLSLFIGILIATGLDRLVPQKHLGQACTHSNIYRLGMVSMLAIAVHNFPEGIATFMAGISDLELGLSIAATISIHNIPEGITIAMPIYYATGNKKRALLFAFMAGISEPLGALLAFLLLRPFISELVLGFVFCVVSGIMLYIAIEEFIPSSYKYGHTKLTVFSTIAGICVMLLAHILEAL